MRSQQRSPLMRNDKHTRGQAVTDGHEAPSGRAELVIILRNAAGGEPVIWQPEENQTDPDDNTNVSYAWITFLRWSAGGYSTA